MSSSTIPSPPSSPKGRQVQKRKADTSLPRLPMLSTQKRQKKLTSAESYQALKTYLQNGGSPSLVTNNGHCLYCCACYNESLDTLDLLRTTTPLPIHQLCKDGKSGLHTSASIGFAEGIVFFLQHGLNVNLATKADQWTALHYAVKANNVDAARCLLDHGARMDLPDRRGRLALHLAIMNRHVDMVDLLIDYQHLSKNNPSHTDLIWDQPPHSAVERAIMAGYAPILDRLLSMTPHPCSHLLETRLLDLTVEWNRIECLELLIRRGYNVNHVTHPEDNHTCALVYKAVQQRKLDLVRVLTNAHARLCHDGWNPSFVYAANHGFMEMIPILLTHNTSTHCIDEALTLVSPATRRHQLLAVILQSKLATPLTPVTPSP